MIIIPEKEVRLDPDYIWVIQTNEINNHLLDPNERAEMELNAREEYDHAVDDLRHTEGITEDDVKDFEKSVIIRKSVDVVKILAEN